MQFTQLDLSLGVVMQSILHAITTLRTLSLQREQTRFFLKSNTTHRFRGKFVCARKRVHHNVYSYLAYLQHRYSLCLQASEPAQRACHSPHCLCHYWQCSNKRCLYPLCHSAGQSLTTGEAGCPWGQCVDTRCSECQSPLHNHSAQLQAAPCRLP